jgi:hypothetical protein
MKYAVIFFTRTNTSRRIAGKIADKLSCELIQITDNMNWKGIIGFIKAGYYSVTNKSVDIEILGNLNGADEYIVVAPLWAGRLAPAARAFIKKMPSEKVHLVISSDGALLKDRSGYKSVTDIENSNNEGLIIDRLVSNLNTKPRF